MIVNFFDDVVQKAKVAFMRSNKINELESIRNEFLGKNGYINQQLKKINVIEKSVRSKLGVSINQAKKDIYSLFLAQKKKIEFKIVETSLNSEILDITLPGRSSEVGSFHPITCSINRIKKFFSNLGFSEVYGPEIESSYFNFDALNIPDNHPSRNKHDTFWFDSNRLLRTHTSGVQIRSMTSIDVPIRIISIGKVYRKDYDKNHTPMFHQIEGLMVDKNVNFMSLKKILYDFLYYFFEKNITLRFRPSYFPFTEPSAEIDMMNIQNMKTKSKIKWVELLGCGMVHPIVLNNVGINTKKYSGFAWGIGVERLTMLLYHIMDMRDFFENDLQFLKQF